MPSQRRILEFLRQSNDGSADLAMATAIPHVDSALQFELIETVLQRADADGLAVLPEIFDQMSEAGRSQIAAGSAKLFSTLRDAIRSPHSRTRQNTLEIIRRSGNPRLSYLAALAIHDGAANIRKDAAETLRQMAEKHRVNHGQTTATLREESESSVRVAETVVATVQMVAEERHYLLTALREALGSFESHHRPEVLEAAMLYAGELDDVLFQGGAILRGKLTQAILEIIGNRLQPHHAPFVYVALTHTEIRRHMVTLLAGCSEYEFFVEFIRHHWMTLDPRIRKHLGAIRAIEWLGDGFEAAFTLPPDVAAMAPSWLLELGVPIEQKVSVLSNLLLTDNPAANRSAIWALTRIDSPDATLAIEGALAHELEAVRRIARAEAEFRRRGSAGRPPSVIRENRPAEWGRLLDSTGLTESFDEMWLHFERIAPDMARSAGKYALEFVPGLVAHLQDRLGDSQPSDRIRALRFVATMGLSSRFNHEIYNLCNDRTVQVRAAAMKSLVILGDATSRRILERAIAEDLPSVQAAALEALERRGEIRDQRVVMPLLESEDAHVRGAAARLLLKRHTPEAANTLMNMLRDRRVDHRCTALWVVDQMHLVSLAHRLQEMANCDPDARIARTAKQVLRRLTPAAASRDVVTPSLASEAHSI